MKNEEKTATQNKLLDKKIKQPTRPLCYTLLLEGISALVVFSFVSDDYKGYNHHRALLFTTKNNKKRVVAAASKESVCLLCD